MKFWHKAHINKNPSYHINDLKENLPEAIITTEMRI